MVEVNNNDTGIASSSKNSRSIIPILGLALYGVFSIFYDRRLLSIPYVASDPSSFDSASLAEQTTVPLPVHQQREEDHCIGLGLKEAGMDKLLSKYKQVFILMPAKAAGSTFNQFTKDCMRSMELLAFAKHAPQLKKKKDVDTAFRSELKMPTLIASHVEQGEHFHEVLKHATDDTLIVYSHRQETNRLISAIKHVVTSRACGLLHGFNTTWAWVAMVGDVCQVQEGPLIEMIRKRLAEIGIGSTRMLTCETYQTIKDNNPNLVFMHYKQAGQLQKLLSKHHCPDRVFKEVRANVGSNKEMSVSVVLEGGPGNNNNGTLVPLEDWLRFKSPILEYSLDLKRDVSCQGITRDLEEELFACPAETLQISGRSYEGRKVLFPV